MTTNEVKEFLKIQQYHLDFMIQNGYFKRTRGMRTGRHCWYLERKEIEKFTKDDILKIYKSHREKNYDNSFNKKCLFSFKGWDEKSLLFCDLVERGYEAEALINFFGISKAMEHYVHDKIRYLKGV